MLELEFWHLLDSDQGVSAKNKKKKKCFVTCKYMYNIWPKAIVMNAYMYYGWEVGKHFQLWSCDHRSWQTFSTIYDHVITEVGKHFQLWSCDHRSWQTFSTMIMWSQKLANIFNYDHVITEVGKHFQLWSCDHRSWQTFSTMVMWSQKLANIFNYGHVITEVGNIFNYDHVITEVGKHFQLYMIMWSQSHFIIQCHSVSVWNIQLPPLHPSVMADLWQIIQWISHCLRLKCFGNR